MWLVVTWIADILTSFSLQQKATVAISAQRSRTGWVMETGIPLCAYKWFPKGWGSHLGAEEVRE